MGLSKVVYGVKLGGAFWKSLYETREMAQAQVDIIQEVSESLGGNPQLSIVEFTLQCEAAPENGQSAVVRKLRTYAPEFEQWWRDRSPKKRKDEVYEIYCVLKRELVQEGQPWDFITTWDTWVTREGLSGSTVSVMELMQRFREDVLSEKSSVV